MTNMDVIQQVELLARPRTSFTGLGTIAGDATRTAGTAPAPKTASINPRFN